MPSHFLHFYSCTAQSHERNFLWITTAHIALYNWTGKGNGTKFKKKKKSENFPSIHSCSDDEYNVIGHRFFFLSLSFNWPIAHWSSLRITRLTAADPKTNFNRSPIDAKIVKEKKNLRKQKFSISLFSTHIYCAFTAACCLAALSLAFAHTLKGTKSLYNNNGRCGFFFLRCCRCCIFFFFFGCFFVRSVLWVLFTWDFGARVGIEGVLVRAYWHMELASKYGLYLLWRYTYACARVCVCV